MVQKKAQTKLGNQATTTKEEKSSVLRSMADPKTPSPQYPDGKTRGPDLKVKMKKSGSINRFRKEIPQPGKPPTPPPHGQKSVARSSAGDGVPNYMKSTSCSDARKELSPPRTRRSSTGSNLSSADIETPTKAVRRSSGLKLARTPSFKPARSSFSASAKKCSKDVLCVEMESQRPTCSSTLKDSKFPLYLTLSAGASEAEGTSAVKVCPYSYCSLNGHRHAPLPPIKCFISSRRRSLKVQRSCKPEVLSPTKLGGKPGDDINGEKKDLDDETDFFLEVYASGDDSKGYPETESFVNQSNNGRDEKVPSVSDEEDAGNEVSDAEFQELAEVVDDNSAESVDNMEWDETETSNSDLDGEKEHSMEKEDDNGGICFNFVTINLNIHVYNDLMKPDEDQQSEISESSRMSDCLNYDQFSVDEVEEAEEVYEEIDEEKSKEEDTITDSAIANPRSSYTRPLRSSPELPDPSKITICKNKCREVSEEEEDDKGFNPRDPNYLPTVPDPDSEKVDLKHQPIDERKNSEDWMVDYALQRTVTKLGSARKKKVALLVEAFEKVRKWDHHHLMSPTAIQACS